MRWERHSGVWCWRDDLYEVAGVSGGKARTCYALAKECLRTGMGGLVTAGARQSPQVNIVAQIGKALAIPTRAYVPSGEPGRELELALAAGCELVPTRPGYNSVIRARAAQYAVDEWWQHVPFGMECYEAVEETASSALEAYATLPAGVHRLVVPVGSAMSLCGLIHASREHFEGNPLPLLGVVVGANPYKRLERWAPAHEWDIRYGLLALEPSQYGYHHHMPEDVCNSLGFYLDPVYEAKCLEHMRPGDALWVVGVRQSTHP